MLVVPAGRAYMNERTFFHDMVVIKDQYTPKISLTVSTATHMDFMKRYLCKQLHSLGGKIAVLNVHFCLPP